MPIGLPGRVAICGNQEMALAVKAVLSELGLDGAELHCESY